MKLEVRELTKQYPHKTALDHVSFTLEEGVYGLLGPNGAGKTTLVNMVAGILRPTGGSVLWDGQDTDALGPRYREVLGFQPQTPSLYASFRADEFLRYMAAVKGLKLTRKELDRRVAELLEQVNLSRSSLAAYGAGALLLGLLLLPVYAVPRSPWLWGPLSLGAPAGYFNAYVTADLLGFPVLWAVMQAVAWAVLAALLLTGAGFVSVRKRRAVA